MKNRRVKIAALAFAILSGLCTAPVSATVLMEPFTEKADIATSLDTGEYRAEIKNAWQTTGHQCKDQT